MRRPAQRSRRRADRAAAGHSVATGTGDDFANPLGCGICAPGGVGVTLGTGEAVASVGAAAIVDPGMLVETHAYPAGHYHLGNPGWLAGGSVAWFLGTFSVTSGAEMSALAASVPPGSEGLLFLPALSGAIAPRWEARARGCFYGMTSAHTKAHFARAIFEGTSFAMRDVVDRFAALGLATDSLRVLGGGAASAVWTQLRADVTGIPAESLDECDSSAMGAAILAMVAAGAAPSVRAAVGLLPLNLRHIEPNRGLRMVYNQSYSHYRTLFAALEPMYV